MQGNTEQKHSTLMLFFPMLFVELKNTNVDVRGTAACRVDLSRPSIVGGHH